MGHFRMRLWCSIFDPQGNSGLHSFHMVPPGPPLEIDSEQKLRVGLVFSGLSLTQTTFIWMKGTLSVK